MNTSDDERQILYSRDDVEIGRYDTTAETLRRLRELAGRKGSITVGGGRLSAYTKRYRYGGVDNSPNLAAYAVRAADQQQRPMITIAVNADRLATMLHGHTDAERRVLFPAHPDAPNRDWMAQWVPTVPTALHGPDSWDSRWNKTIRRIIDALADHGDVLVAHGLPKGRKIELRYEHLTKPKGLEVFAQVNDENWLGGWGTRLAAIYFQRTALFLGTHDPVREACESGATPYQVAETFVYQLAARLNNELRDVQLALGATEACTACGETIIPTGA